MEKIELSTISKGDAAKFKDWWNYAVPGGWYTYYHGMYLPHKNIAVVQVKNILWDYACDGKVYLFQKKDKNNPGMYYYLAQKTKKQVPKLWPKRGKYD